MRRIAFYFFYDAQGVVDDYIIYKLRKLREHVDAVFFISNSELMAESLSKVEPVVDVLHFRENIGFDVWAYKEAIEKFGWERLAEYDEAVFLNYTFFGPIFPFSEMFTELEKVNVDFWGISAHQDVSPNPFTGIDKLPFHIQSLNS